MDIMILDAREQQKDHQSLQVPIIVSSYPSRVIT